MQDGAAGVRTERLTEALAGDVDKLRTELAADTQETLAWLIADDRIDIRIAVPSGDLDGLYHEKVGIITDAYGQRVAFTGGVNETAAALTHCDSLTIDTSWRGRWDAETVDRHAARFEQLWTGGSDNLTVYDLPRAIEKDIAALRSHDERPYDLPAGDGGGIGGSDGGSGAGVTGGLTDQAPIKLWPPQSNAVRAWVDNEYMGLFAMATGTGKSYAAIAARNAYKESVDTFLTVIAVPEKSLAMQWDSELKDWGIDRGIYAFSVNNSWQTDVSDAATNAGFSSPILLTTHHTAASQTFRRHVARANVPVLLIADEVYGLGASTFQNALIDAYDARLGLSATHKRYMDAAGTQTLCEYFDDVVYEYDIADAIEDQYLVPYEYHPVIVEMTDDEMARSTSKNHRVSQQPFRAMPPPRKTSKSSPTSERRLRSEL
ncbi:DEAD/DEAH box helicase family protein [Salinigranum halophilum]|uniref:DEAD/DEAH box helicase family protein n=1 Tax=Salinigranum halophilum TaxID=2565931 RepID=UPI0010A8AF0C|nr:DEAD/DEAH box helicase family protein [Salinigranum halophilum]